MSTRSSELESPPEEVNEILDDEALKQLGLQWLHEKIERMRESGSLRTEVWVPTTFFIDGEEMNDTNVLQRLRNNKGRTLVYIKANVYIEKDGTPIKQTAKIQRQETAGLYK